MQAHAFDTDGFAVLPRVMTEADCERLLAHAVDLGPVSAGSRCLLQQAWCGNAVAQLRTHPLLAGILPHDYLPVQCTYFEKSQARNWLVPIHQDLSIPVAERVDHPELRGWSEKEGSLFVQPPAELLARLVAVRLHLDPCALEDGPLQLVAGSHRQGRIAAPEAAALRRAGPPATPTLDRGDALAMRPLVLHASSKASGESLRRVLHIVFGPPALPYGLRWPQAVAAASQRAAPVHADAGNDGIDLHSAALSDSTQSN